MKSTNPKPEPKRLEDLRGTVLCMRCDKPSPAAGARAFRAHWVCAACAVKLQALPERGRASA